MNLSWIFLQLGSPFLPSADSNPWTFITQYVLPFAVLGVVVFVGYNIYKNHRRRSEYPPGTGRPLGWFDIFIFGNITLHGMIRKYDLPFMPEVIDFLKEISYMKNVIEDLEGYVKAKGLFVYEMRTVLPSGFLGLGGGAKDILLITTFQLESDEISYEEPIVEEGILSSGLDRRRIVRCSAKSRFHDIATPDGIKDIWVLAPVPEPAIDESKELGFIDTEEEFPKHSHIIQVKMFKQSESIAKVIYNLELVAVAEKLTEQKTMQINELMDNNADLHAKIMEMQRQMDVMRMRLDEQKLIGTMNAPFFPFRGEPWGWHIMFAIAPISGYVLTPSLTRALEPWMGAIIGLGIVIGVRFLTLRGQRREDELAMAEMGA